MTTPPCVVCGCTHEAGAAAHAIVIALAAGDLDKAIESGLLDGMHCDRCSNACITTLIEARDSRLRAMASRERYRARQARLQRRADERAAARAVPAPVTTSDAPAPALPSAAALALERAKARAAERHKP